MEPTKKTSERIRKLALLLIENAYSNSDWEDEDLFETLTWLMEQYNMEKRMEDWNTEKKEEENG